MVLVSIGQNLWVRWCCGWTDSSRTRTVPFWKCCQPKGFVPHPTASNSLWAAKNKQPKGAKPWWWNKSADGSYLILFSSSITRAKGLSILYSLHLPVLLFHPCLPLLMLSASFFICSFLLSFVLSITSTSRRICKAKSLQIFHFLTYILVSGVCTATF